MYHNKKVLKRYRLVWCQVLVIGGDTGQSASGAGVNRTFCFTGAIITPEYPVFFNLFQKISSDDFLCYF